MVNNFLLQLYYFSARDCLALMQEGSELTKLKANGRLYRRYYWLSDNLTEIRWMPTSKTYTKAKSKYCSQCSLLCLVQTNKADEKPTVTVLSVTLGILAYLQSQIPSYNVYTLPMKAALSWHKIFLL